MNLESSVVELANEIAKNVVRVRADTYKDLNTDALTKKLVNEYYNAYNITIREIYRIKEMGNQEEKTSKILD